MSQVNCALVVRAVRIRSWRHVEKRWNTFKTIERFANAKAARALAAVALGVAFLPLLSLPARGEALSGSATVPGGGVVTFTNVSSTNWVNGELLLFYTDPAAAGSFTFPGTTLARILAVGGGGGGGGVIRSAYSATATYGGGGGGGAGGFVETNALFDAATYTVGVGKGGDGGMSHITPGNVTSGGDGGDTSILKDGESWWFPTAKGGGGGAGGNNKDGASGGSGGGGSQYKNGGTIVPHAGGEGVSGQGHAGGAGDVWLYGGGGGGAGAAGAAASSTGGGAGGDGRESDITGESLYYAGGGGGGYCLMGKTGVVIPGGQGGGGKGGYGKDPPGDATFYGGGGGGGSYSTGNGAVGSGYGGVVIVRIAASVTGGLEKPSNVNYTYDGTAHAAVSPSAFYSSIEGDNTATEVGVYKAKVTLAEGIKWSDDTVDPVTVIMTISPEGSFSGMELVTGAPVKYVGATEVTRIGDDLLLKFTGAGFFTLPGTTSARILAVGGGGGGGGVIRSAYSATATYGGGGGGGAGGFVETNALFDAATYTVDVGKGGEGGISHITPGNVTSGGDGGDTSILKDGESWWFPTAKGGGGGAGGNNKDGRSGGSGGGGSQYKSGGTIVPHAGGEGVSGQGHAGGAGDVWLYGGGGGGAGAAGAAASSTGGGAGGDGRESDITGESLYYAGGGGGGYCLMNNTSGSIPGGHGGGGNGGYAKIPPSNATFYGGGGGGGSYSTGNGAVGSGYGGVVIVRIAAIDAYGGRHLNKVDTRLEEIDAQIGDVETALAAINGGSAS